MTTIIKQYYYYYYLASHDYLQFLLPAMTASVPEGIELLITYSENICNAAFDYSCMQVTTWSIHLEGCKLQ